MMPKTVSMADNSVAHAYDPLVQMLEDALLGVHDFGAAVGVKQNDEAALKAVLVDLVGDPTTVPPTPGLKDKSNTAKAAKSAATAAMRSALSNGKTIAVMCMGVLKPILGTQWNAQWTAAGFTAASLAIPDNPMTLLQQMGAYFTANPGDEVSTAKIHATAADCLATAAAIGAASLASNTSNSNAGTAKSNLEAGIKAARSRLSGLRDELAQLLADDDARWYSFGFERPSDPTTPHVPLHVTITPGAPKMIFVDFDDAKNADAGYRVTVTDTATPPKQLAELLVAESEATFTDLPSGTAIKVVVTARNSSGGESGPSAPATGNVP